MTDRKIPEFMQPCQNAAMKRDCNSPKMTYEGMDGEQYECPICGYRYFLDYEEIR